MNYAKLWDIQFIDKTIPRELFNRDAWNCIIQLMIAYAEGELSSSIDWEKLDLAFSFAKLALPGEYKKVLADIRANDEAEENAA